jgi:hypothetical protein
MWHAAACPESVTTFLGGTWLFADDTFAFFDGQALKRGPHLGRRQASPRRPSENSQRNDREIVRADFCALLQIILFRR